MFKSVPKPCDCKFKFTHTLKISLCLRSNIAPLNRMTMTFNKINLSALLCCFFLVLSSASFASGSFGGGSQLSPRSNSQDRQYNKGKVLVRKRLRCDGCPLHDQKLNKKTARAVFEQLRAGEFSEQLNLTESRSVAVYLARRYRLRN